MAANSVGYGFVTLSHLFGERLTEVGVEVIRKAIRESTNAWNEEINILLEGWCERSTKIKERVELPSSGTLQPIDEFGNPLPVRPSGAYDVGYPIQGAGTAWGTSRITQELMTVEEANRFTMDAFRRDATWMRQHMLASILDNTEWTYTDDLLGDVTVKPLANGDTVPYLRTGATSATSDDHYLAQAADIGDDANIYKQIYAELFEHPSNSGPFVAYVASNLVDDTTALSTFYEEKDPDVIAAITETRLKGDGNATIQGPAGDVLGKVDRIWVAEWRSLPDDYIVGVSLGAGPFVRMREYDSKKLQGFFPEFHDPDGSRFVNRFLRYCGFGVRDRVAAVVAQIGNASYQIPTGYTTPQA